MNQFAKNCLNNMLEATKILNFLYRWCYEY